MYGDDKTPPENRSINNHILLIEDAGLIDKLEMFLSNQGYKVTTASNGKQAAELFCTSNIDLIICDFLISEVNDFNLLDFFFSKAPDIPVIITSASQKFKDVEVALRQGAIDFFIKPITDHKAFGAVIKATLTNECHHKSAERAYQELATNFQKLKQDTVSEAKVKSHLLPEYEKQIGDFLFHHSIRATKSNRSQLIDYFEIDERFIGFYIADFAAGDNDTLFMMMLLKSLINQPLRQYRLHSCKQIINPDALLGFLNRELLKTNVGCSISIFYAVIDKAGNNLRYCQAGYTPTPILFDSRENRLIESDSIPLGIFSWSQYQVHSLDLKPSFTLGMFSLDETHSTINDSLDTSGKILKGILDNYRITMDELYKLLDWSQKKIVADKLSFFVVQQ